MPHCGLPLTVSPALGTPSCQLCPSSKAMAPSPGPPRTPVRPLLEVENFLLARGSDYGYTLSLSNSLSCLLFQDFSRREGSTMKPEVCSSSHRYGLQKGWFLARLCHGPHHPCLQYSHLCDPPFECGFRHEVRVENGPRPAVPQVLEGRCHVCPGVLGAGRWRALGLLSEGRACQRPAWPRRPQASGVCGAACEASASSF